MLSALKLLLFALAPVAASQASDFQRFGPWLGQADALVEPMDAAVDTNGRIYIVEAGSHRVSVRDPDGARLFSFGSYGRGVGQLREPSGIALDGQFLYVADTGNDRIVQWQLKAGRPEFVSHIGSSGMRPGQLRAPVGLDAEDGRVLVADTGNSRLQLFGADGALQMVIGSYGSGPGQMIRPLDACFHNSGFAASDSGNHRLQIFDGAGSYLRSVGEWGPFPGFFSGPAGLASFQGLLYAVDSENHRVQAFGPDYKQAYEWGVHAIRPGEGGGLLHYPKGLAIHPDGSRAVLVEPRSDRAQFYGIADGPARDFAARLSLFSGTTGHYGMALDTAGDLLATIEPETQEVLVYDISRRDKGPILISRFGGYGPEVDRFLELTDVKLDARDWTIWASDGSGRRVQVFRLERKPGEGIRFDPFRHRLVQSVNLTAVLAAQGAELDSLEPIAIERDRAGNIYLLDRRGEQVLCFDPDWKLLYQFGGRGSEVGQFLRPTDLVLDENAERIYIVDQGNRRIQVFNLQGRSLFSFSGRNAEEDTRSRPHGLTLAVAPSSGSIHGGTEVRAGQRLLYVSDAGRHMLLLFDDEGHLLHEWGGRGLGAGQFFRPRGLATDLFGRVVCLDHGNHRLQLFQPNGSFFCAIGPRLYVEPTRDASSQRSR